MTEYASDPKFIHLLALTQVLLQITESRGGTCGEGVETVRGTAVYKGNYCAAVGRSDRLLYCGNTRIENVMHIDQRVMSEHAA